MPGKSKRYGAYMEVYGPKAAVDSYRRDALRRLRESHPGAKKRIRESTPSNFPHGVKRFRSFDFYFFSERIHAWSFIRREMGEAKRAGLKIGLRKILLVTYPGGALVDMYQGPPLSKAGKAKSMPAKKKKSSRSKKATGGGTMTAIRIVHSKTGKTKAKKEENLGYLREFAKSRKLTLYRIRTVKGHLVADLTSKKTAVPAKGSKTKKVKRVKVGKTKGAFTIVYRVKKTKAGAKATAKRRTKKRRSKTTSRSKGVYKSGPKKGRLKKGYKRVKGRVVKATKKSAKRYTKRRAKKRRSRKVSGKIRRHKGIIQSGPKKGKLKPGYKYGKKIKGGKRAVVKAKKKSRR